MEKQKLTRSELKRQSILEAARRSFQEIGVDGTSMDLLAMKAGVSKKTVYNHFPSKESLFRHLMSGMWDRAQQQIHVKYGAQKPLEAQLLTLVGAEIELFGDEAFLGLARMAIGYLFFKPESLREEMEIMTRQETALLRWLRAAVEDGRLDIDDPEFASTQLRSLVEGWCFWPQVTGMAPVPSREEQRHMAEQSIAMFLAHYRAD